jgi:pyruvate kinase
MSNFEYPEVWFTYGPQTKDDDVLESLLLAGATGVRLTFSYGTSELQIQRASQVRNVADQIGKRVLIVADLQGEKCRFSKIEGVDEVRLTKDQPFLLTSGATRLEGTIPELQIQIPAYLEELEEGDIVVEGDGALLIKVLQKKANGVLCAPLTQGVIHPGRGIVVQKSGFRPTPMTEKDKADLVAAAKSRAFDAVAISFVGDPQDIQEARKSIQQCAGSMSVVAKIETQLGIEQIDLIAREADLLMAARGDLALTLPWVDLYEAVSKLCSAAEVARKPWVVATQLAEGLERFVFPTRAEICDLAHWISAGAFGAMLSFETAFGPYPKESVRAVRQIVDRYRR